MKISNDKKMKLTKEIYRQLFAPFSGLIWLLAFFVFFPYMLKFSIDHLNSILIFFSLLLGLLLISEIFFRIAYKIKYQRHYLIPPRIPFEKFFIEPHPYIPYTNKRNFTISGGRADYDLHKGIFFFGEYQTNNYGFSNGIDGGRDVIVPKPNGIIRVNCIGASTTGNYIEHEGISYSYPIELENILNSESDYPVEVNNFGQGGYNSADLVVRFMLQIVDTLPDIVIIYHAYNDIRAYLTPGFEPDYSHARYNLAETYWKFSLASKVPLTPFGLINFLIGRLLPIDHRNVLLDQVSKGSIDESMDSSKGLETYKRNLQYIIDICKSRGIQVILSTYCHFLHNSIKAEPLSQLYGKIVTEENKVMRSLATKNDLFLVDNASVVPQDEKYFVDSIHFTPLGMKLIAKNFASAVLDHLSKKRR